MSDGSLSGCFVESIFGSILQKELSNTLQQVFPFHLLSCQGTLADKCFIGKVLLIGCLFLCGWKKQMWCNRVSVCGWRCTSFVFLKRWLYFSFVCSFNVLTVGRYRVTHNGMRICEAGDFWPICICEPKYNTKPESLKRTEKPRFCKCAVMGWATLL